LWAPEFFRNLFSRAVQHQKENQNVFHIVGGPVTVSLGTNVLVGRDPGKLRPELSRVLAGQAKKGTIHPLWDGHAGERIVAVIAG
jgi:hypothetical protein